MKTILLAFTFLTLIANSLEYQATYRITFESNWSSITHPINYPNGAHFSQLIGNSHNATGGIWHNDELSSAGMEQMSETGGTTVLTGEINTLIANLTAENLLLGFGASAVDIYTFDIDITESHPLVSLVTMIAPSPDWFLGIDSINLLENGAWVNNLSIDLLPYDTGTDSGTSYSSSNNNTNPPETISRIMTSPFPNNTPLARLNFELLNSSGVADVIFINNFE